jgi:hypothetical protein
MCSLYHFIREEPFLSKYAKNSVRVFYDVCEMKRAFIRCAEITDVSFFRNKPHMICGLGIYVYRMPSSIALGGHRAQAHSLQHMAPRNIP